ncbi:O-antigen ligase family protein [Salipiger sp. 1_MG-2023]|uniref:O-antigen ligase family protein n=1 Tax=Salipiger sp. 1_MG-2023 TaxID=3062665 RepID=UPI0026E32F8B|nr:O-antigen ligase family protein [Salipiger sp. 1_MG-2023]MDO6587040.1 O-antigen ligase family protein [Salipiger sp. 1_MG-2023]
MTSLAQPIHGGSQHGRLRLHISNERRDLLLFALWCLVTFVQFPGDSLILYPLALYYSWAILRDQSRIVTLMAKSWVVLLFPIWCLISPIWAVEPAAAFKKAVYLGLTIMICYQVAATMRPRAILYSLFIAVGGIGLINVVYAYGTGDITTGIFAQKNTMGKNMVVLWVICVSVFIDSGSSRGMRLAGLAMSGVAVLMAFHSESATAVLLIFGTGALIALSVMFLIGGLMRLSRVAALCFGLAFTSIVGAVLVSNMQSNPAELVLQHFGKSSTLTGRTVLWDYAEMQIAERPLLGVGEDGFWQYAQSPLVRKIFFEFYKKPGDSFNFHNSFYEITVHQGLIGVGIASIALIWALLQVVRGALVFGATPQIFFLAMAAAVLARSMTEADFLKPFVLFHMVLWIGALSSLRLRMQYGDTWRFKES